MDFNRALGIPPRSFATPCVAIDVYLLTSRPFIKWLRFGAMEAGIGDHVWTLEEIVGLIHL
jgi:hypothetical protein